MTAKPRFQANLAYKNIEADLRGSIMNGKLEPGSRITPEKDLAERYAVSRGTVRRALACLVTAGLLKTVKGSGTYVTAPDERRLAQGPHQHIVFLCFATALPAKTVMLPDTYIPMLEGFTEACQKARLKFIFAHVGPDWTPPDILKTDAVAGIIFYGSVHPDFYRRYIAPYPNVAIQYRSPDIPGSCVKGDAISLATQAVQQLQEAGYRRLGFVTNEVDTPISQERYHAFQMALKQLGLTYRPDYCAVWQRPSSNGFLEYEETMTDYLPFLKPMFAKGRNQAPDAFICADDWRARCLITALKQLGLRVPQDVAVLGACNDQSFNQSPPVISGFCTNLKQICNTAITLLAAIIRDDVTQIMTIQIPPVIFTGETFIPKAPQESRHRVEQTRITRDEWAKHAPSPVLKQRHGRLTNDDSTP